jgi:hypothetical protein
MHSHVEEGSCGTELNIVQEGISELIPTEGCYLGWQKSLTLLAKLIDRDPATGQPTAAGGHGVEPRGGIWLLRLVTRRLQLCWALAC